MEEVKLTNYEKLRTLGEKETYKYLGILEADTIKQVEMKEKIKKEYLRRTKKTTWDKTLLQELCQRDKYLGCLPRRTLGTILEVDQRRTQTNGLENKKTNDDA